MFKSRITFLTLTAALLSIFAGLLIRKLVDKPPAVVEVPVASRDGKQTIIVAANDIPYLKVIREEDLREHAIATADLPNEAAQYFSDLHGLVGKVAMEIIRKGALIQKADVDDHDAGSPLALEIRPQYRAMTVRVDDVKGVGGFLLRGNRVDVVASPQSGGDHEPPKLLAENLRILAVDQEVAQSAEKPLLVRSVTIEVPLSRVELLTDAQQAGTIHLLLRNPEDFAPARLSAPASAPEERSFIMIKGQERGPIATIRCAEGEACTAQTGGGGQ
jgi:pilus assembly protein CpaB